MKKIILTLNFILIFSSLGYCALNERTLGYKNINSNVTPSKNATYDLGSSTKEWRNLYISGTATLAAITVSGDITLPDASWVGLGASAARMTVNDLVGTDSVVFEDCDVTLGSATNNAGFFTMIQGETAGDPTFSISQVGDDVTLAQTVGDLTITSAGNIYYNGNISGAGTVACGGITTNSITDTGDIQIGTYELDCGTIEFIKGAQVGDPNAVIELSPDALGNLSITTDTGDISINATGNDINFNDDNLVTTGTLGAGATTVTSIDTGYGANELWDMDQHVLTSSAVTFAGVTSSNTIFAGADGVIGLGDIKGMNPVWIDADEVTISSGRCEANGKYYELTATTDHLTCDAFSNGSYTYLYIDDSESAEPAITWVWSTTTPTWSDSLQGWYNGSDRYIATFYCDGAATLEMFNCVQMSDKILRFSWNNRVQIASSMDPSGAWQTPDDAESSTKLPTTAVEVELHVFGNDATAVLSVGATALELATGVSCYQEAELNFGGYNNGGAGNWLTLGTSRNVRIFGDNDDDNTLSCYIRGYTIRR